MRPCEEINLETRAGGMALIHWGSKDPDAPKVICLHGWLDNAHSFLPLAQHLENLDLYALDFPGHGHSEHRPPGTRYSFSEYLFDLDSVREALGWDVMNILGHSMGGGVGSMYSAALPDSVRRLCVLDGLGPVTRKESETTQQLRRSLERARRPRRPLRRFESLDQMTEARENGFLDISRPAARLICERAARQVSDGDGLHYVWRTDPELRWATPIMFSEKQVLNCLSSIEAPVLSMHASQGALNPFQKVISARRGVVKNLRHRGIEGNHHFHMDLAESIAPEIEAFFLEKKA